MQINEIIRFENINKEFPGVKALDNVSFSIGKGNIHALLGENGAGKSTLMKILSGAYQKDSGTVYIDGEPQDITSPKQAESLGIATIYQELNLIPGISVAENIFLNRQPQRGKTMIEWGKVYKDSQQILDSMDVAISARAQLSTLRVAQQQMVEIAKAISLNSRILIMDEPTSSLSEGETRKLFDVIANFKKQGITIVYISHRMDEIFEICDSYTVMRDGTFVNSGYIKDTTEDNIIEQMVGRSMDMIYPAKENVAAEVVLRVENLGDGKKIEGINFSLKRGEILGFGGLMGAGRTETMRLLFGADKKTSGKVEIDGKQVAIHDPQDAIKNGMGLLPEDRKQEGLVTELSVMDNMLMTKMESAFQNGLFSSAKAEQLCSQYIGDLDIKTPSSKQRVKFLSGGNQQKVVLAKWLNAAPEIIILDEPTRGIDVNAKSEIYKLIVQLAKSGKAIIFVSSELPELIGLCDRVIVMHEGRISGELSKNDLNQADIMRLATGGM